METISVLNTTAHVKKKSKYELLDKYWASGEILVGLVMILIVLF